VGAAHVLINFIEDSQKGPGCSPIFVFRQFRRFNAVNGIVDVAGGRPAGGIIRVRTVDLNFSQLL
jgi:hypothetical protein